MWNSRSQRVIGMSMTHEDMTCLHDIYQSLDEKTKSTSTLCNFCEGTSHHLSMWWVHTTVAVWMQIYHRCGVANDQKFSCLWNWSKPFSVRWCQLNLSAIKVFLVPMALFLALPIQLSVYTGSSAQATRYRIIIVSYIMYLLVCVYNVCVCV